MLTDPDSVDDTDILNLSGGLFEHAHVTAPVPPPPPEPEIIGPRLTAAGAQKNARRASRIVGTIAAALLAGGFAAAHQVTSRSPQAGAPLAAKAAPAPAAAGALVAHQGSAVAASSTDTPDMAENIPAAGNASVPEPPPPAPAPPPDTAAAPGARAAVTMGAPAPAAAPAVAAAAPHAGPAPAELSLPVAGAAGHGPAIETSVVVAPAPNPLEALAATRREPDRAAAAVAIASAARSASACMPKQDGPQVARVHVVFAPSGRATSAVLEGGPLVGTEAGACLARALRGARVAPFEGEAVSVATTVHM